MIRTTRGVPNFLLISLTLIAAIIFHTAIRSLNAYLEMVDLIGNFELYSAIRAGGDISQMTSTLEPILPMLWGIIGQVIGSIDLKLFLMVEVGFIVILLYAMIAELKLSFLSVLFLLTFIDSLLVVQFFRQFAATIISLIVINRFYIRRKNPFKLLISTILVTFLHSFSILFVPLCLAATNLSTRKLKIIVALGFICSLFLEGKNPTELLNYFHNIPILDKAYFAVMLYNEGSATELRLIVLIAIGVSFFIEDMSPLQKICILFLSISMLFSGVPIIGVRMGFAGNAVLIGLVYYGFLIRIITVCKAIFLPRLVKGHI